MDAHLDDYLHKVLCPPPRECWQDVGCHRAQLVVSRVFSRSHRTSSTTSGGLSASCRTGESPRVFPRLDYIVQPPWLGCGRRAGTGIERLYKSSVPPTPGPRG